MKITTNRKWVRLVGTRHDVLYWRSDDRTPPLFPFVRRFDLTTLGTREKWIAEILFPKLSKHGLLKTVELYLPEKSYSDDDAYAMLAGYQIDNPQQNEDIKSQKPSGEIRQPPKWDEAPYCFKCRSSFTFTLRQHHCRSCGHSYCNNCSQKTAPLPDFGIAEPVRVCDPCFVKLHEFKSLKEVVVFRQQKVVHIYNVVEHGRRFYRSLVWSSDARHTLHDMLPVHPYDVSWSVMDRYSAGHGEAHSRASFPHESLVITRNLATAAENTQMYMPTRYLRGLLPEALLDTYVFWQESDDSLTGYLRRELQEKMLVTSVLRVELFKDAMIGATAKVTRKPVRPDDPVSLAPVSYTHLTLPTNREV